MKKRIIAVICIAVLALSFASARVVNFSLGPSFGYFKGIGPMDEDATTYNAYSGVGFGFDTTFSLTFGDRAEIFFQEVTNFNFDEDSMFESGPMMGYSHVIGVNYKSRIGYEHAVVTDPVKLSLGIASVVEVDASFFQSKYEEDATRFPLVVNVGIGVSAKAEFVVSSHWAFYVKGDFDYLPFSAYAVGYTPDDGEDINMNAAWTNNISAGVSAGAILYF